MCVGRARGLVDGVRASLVVVVFVGRLGLSGCLGGALAVVLEVGLGVRPGFEGLRDPSEGLRDPSKASTSHAPLLLGCGSTGGRAEQSFDDVVRLLFGLLDRCWHPGSSHQ